MKNEPFTLGVNGSEDFFFKRSAGEINAIIPPIYFLAGLPVFRLVHSVFNRFFSR